MERVRDCRTCANAIYDEVWGEYKCKIDKKQHALQGRLAAAGCGYHLMKDLKEKRWKNLKIKL